MAKELEREALREYEKRKKRNRRRRMIIVTSILLIAIAVGAIYFIRLLNKTYKNYEVIHKTESVSGNDVHYISYNTAVVRYTRDGAVAMNKSGDVIWNGSYEMKDPIAVTCKKYIAIADRGGNSVQVYNVDGQVGNFTTTYNIVDIAVASQGVTAILTEDNESNYITMYDEDGSDVIFDKKIGVSEEGYPMDLAISTDGQKLMVSFMNFTKGVLQSTISFLNLGAVGQNSTNRFVGAFVYEDSVIPTVAFLDNNTACAYKDSGFVLFSVPEKPEVIKEEPIEEHIQSVFYDNNYTGVIVKNSEGEIPYRILLYDFKGTKVLDKKLDFDYENVMISGDEIVLHNKLSCKIIKTNGKMKYEGTFDSDILGFYPQNNMDRYYLINPSNIEDIKLVE